MYFDTPVPVPDEPGKITFREKAGTVYVYYETGRTYKPDKKYNVAKRVTVGKLADPVDRSRMYPNDKFAAHFPGELPEGREEARRGDLSFCKDPKHVQLVESTKASAVLLPPDWDKGAPCSVIRVADPNHACMTAAKMFAPPEPVRAPGIHPTAIVDPSAKLGKDVHVGAFTVVEKGAEIGDGAVVEAQVFIGEGCKVGAKTHIYPQVTLREGTIVGADCIVHCGVRLGGDGYGFNNGRREDGSVYIEKIPQLGIVEIGDGVEIGSNTTIDRARFGETRVGRGTKIDNLVQIAHNCVIGEDSVMCAQSGMAGTCTLGKRVICAGQAGLAGHLKLGDDTVVGAQAGVPKSLPGGQVYLGSPAMPRLEFGKQVAMVNALPKLKEQLKALSKRVAELEAALARAGQ